jgi:hypothetical protein
MTVLTAVLGKRGVTHPNQHKETERKPIGPRQQLNDFHGLMLLKENGQLSRTTHLFHRPQITGAIRLKAN